jgi:FkbM family methyltransferase
MENYFRKFFLVKLLDKIFKKIIINFRISFKLGADFFSKIKLFLISFWLLIRKRLGFKKDLNFRLKLKKFNKIFIFYLTNDLDLTILREIFLDDEYDFDLKEFPKIIFDLGGHVGLSTIYFKLKYPEAKIFVFEPDAKNFEKLKRNVKQFNDIFIFNLVISDKNGKERFYIYPESSISSSIIKRLPYQDFVEIESRDLDSLFKELSIDQIDLIKFDIEGAEFRIFKNFLNLSNVKNLIGELHLDLTGEDKNNFLDIFKDFVISLKQISSQRYIVKMSRR